MLTGIRSQIAGPAAVVASNGTGQTRAHCRACGAKRRAGRRTRRNRSDQSSPPPAKTDGQGTTENNGAQDTVKSLELARQTLADAGQAGPAELIQQQIDALKGKAKESEKGTTNSPLSKIKSLRWNRVKLVKQIARTKDEEQNLRKKAAEALVEAEEAKSRLRLKEAQGEPTPSRKHLFQTLYSRFTVLKMPRKLQTRLCSLLRRRNMAIA